MNPVENPFVLTRRARKVGDDWLSSSSWLGGLPKLGERAWPVDSSGHPMHFMAQIDMSEIARIDPYHHLPQSGSLAFFFGAYCWESYDQEGKVLFIPKTPDEFTPVPDEKPSTHSDGWRDLFGDGSEAAPQSFLHWPIEASHFPVDENLLDGNKWSSGDLGEQIKQKFCANLNQFAGTVNQWQDLYKSANAGESPLYWADVQLFADVLQSINPERILNYKKKSLQIAERKWKEVAPEGILNHFKRLDTQQQALKMRLKKAQHSLAETEQLIPAFKNFVHEIANWADGSDPWRQLEGSERCRFVEAFERAKRGDLAGISKSHIHLDLSSLSDITYMRLATHPEAEVYQKLPGLIRQQINTEMRIPQSGWHQLLGPAIGIQNAPEDHADEVLLLQLNYDECMQWQLGDCGAIQYWIDPKDLAEAEFGKVTLSFDSH